MIPPHAQAIEQAVQKKKRILLLRRDMERARAGGGDGQGGGFLRRLVNSVVRPGQSRTPAELILSLQAEVGCLTICTTARPFCL